MNHARATLGVIALLCIATLAGGEELGLDGAYLFVSSEPFGARITIDGTDTGATTPALLTLELGAYTVGLDRDGHQTAQIAVRLEAPWGAVHRELPALYVTVTTPEEPGDQQRTVPIGEYQMERSDGTVSLVPLYEFEALRFTANVLFPLAVGAAAGMVAWTYVAPPQASTLAIWPVVTAQLIAGGVGATAVVLEMDRTRFLDRWQPPARPYFPRAAARLLAAAQEQLAQGDIPAAVELFAELIRSHPDSPGIPEALYTEGRLRALGGQPDLAQELLLELVIHYPTVAYHDRALFQLARLEVQDSEPERAEAHLRRLTYSDPSITPEDVRVFRELWLPQSAR